MPDRKIPEGFVTKDEILKRRPITAEDRQAIDASKCEALLEIGLHELRERTGVTQTAIAERMATSRPNISRIEREADVRLSTLERYVRAVGGSLHVEAILPGGDRVDLIGKAETPAQVDEITTAAATILEQAAALGSVTAASVADRLDVTKPGKHIDLAQGGRVESRRFYGGDHAVDVPGAPAEDEGTIAKMPSSDDPHADRPLEA